jgi:TDG/mug DNA glycosylase family protein
MQNYLVFMHPDNDTISADSQFCESGLPPVLGQSPEVVILGSFPGRQSLLHHEYYGNPQNHFWKIVEALFGIDHRLPYNVKTSRLTDRRVALWDVISSCCRHGSADTRIRNPVFNDLPGFFTSCPALRLITLNGSTAGRYFSLLKIPVQVPVVVLPSTSPANTRFTLSEKVKRWEIIRHI